MSILCHIILFFYTIAVGAASLIAVAVFGRFIPDAQVWNEFLYLSTRWETFAVAIVVLLCSLYLLIQSLSTNKKSVSVSETLIVHGNIGEVQVSLEALKDMATKIARSIAGVRDVKVKLKMTKDMSESKSKVLIPNFNIKLTVGEQDNVTEVSDQLKTDLNDYLSKYIGVDNSQINILVTTISNGQSSSKKRVV